MLEHPERPQSRLVDAAIAAILVAGGGAPLLLGIGALLGWATHTLVSVIAVAALWISGAIGVYRRIRRNGRRGFRIAFEVLVLGVLPCWGLAYSHFMGHEGCQVTACDAGTTAMRPFAEPEVLGLVALHAISADPTCRRSSLPPCREQDSASSVRGM